MEDGLKSINTRFRAYQLGQAGSSFSYCYNDDFTLIEAVITDVNVASLKEEMAICKKKKINTLHITSWDKDHCSADSLAWILENLQPKKIEYPGYEPHTENGFDCLDMIKNYESTSCMVISAISIDPEYIRKLTPVTGMSYKDIVYHPKELQSSSNNNSTVKLFRKGSFNVLSLGDVESDNIASMLRACKVLCHEVDVMILAHHGADNGFTSKKFLKALKPSVAICSSNYDNQYDHPKQEVRNLLHEQNIRLFTTKTGDVIIESIGNHNTKYKVTNLITNSTNISSCEEYKPKKVDILKMNEDARRSLYIGKGGIR